MSLIKFNPFAPAKNNLNNLVDEFFNRSIGDIVGSDFVMTHPSVNIIETADNYKVKVAAPGLEKSDFKLNIENDHLTITSEKEASVEEKEDKKITRREFNYSSFKRSFFLPDTVDKTQISASYNEGILVISIPKKEEAIDKGPRSIKIS